MNVIVDWGRKKGIKSKKERSYLNVIVDCGRKKGRKRKKERKNERTKEVT